MVSWADDGGRCERATRETRRDGEGEAASEREREKSSLDPRGLEENAMAVRERKKEGKRAVADLLVVALFLFKTYPVALFRNFPAAIASDSWFANGRNSRNSCPSRKVSYYEDARSRYTSSRSLLVESVRSTGFIGNCREVRNRFLRAHEI